jgi:guanylate kinase
MSYCDLINVIHSIDKECDCKTCQCKTTENNGGEKAAADFGMNARSLTMYDVVKPAILCIVGESGTGKTTAADYIEETYGINMIRSYTDRLRRPEEGDCHTFITEEDFDAIDDEEMVAFTNFRGYRYCCLHEDIQQLNTYVIDEVGYAMINMLFGDVYDIKGLRIHRDRGKRVKDVGWGRIRGDKDRFHFPDKMFDFIIVNNLAVDDFEEHLDYVVNDCFGVVHHVSYSKREVELAEEQLTLGERARVKAHRNRMHTSDKLAILYLMALGLERHIVGMHAA